MENKQDHYKDVKATVYVAITLKFYLEKICGCYYYNEKTYLQCFQLGFTFKKNNKQIYCSVQVFIHILVITIILAD